jgi:hypothetical protein
MINADLLLGRILGKLNTLADIALEAIVASLEQLLLVVIGATDDVNRLLRTAGLNPCQSLCF